MDIFNRKRVKELEKQADQLMKERQGLKDSSKALRMDVTLLAIKINELEKENNRLKTFEIDFKESLDRVATPLKEKVTDLTKENRELNEHVKNVVRDCQKGDEKIVSIKEENAFLIGEMGQHIKNLQAELKKHKEPVVKKFEVVMERGVCDVEADTVRHHDKGISFMIAGKVQLHCTDENLNYYIKKDSE